jgi:hypothetical protein
MMKISRGDRMRKLRQVLRRRQGNWRFFAPVLLYFALAVPGFLLLSHSLRTCHWRWNSCGLEDHLITATLLLFVPTIWYGYAALYCLVTRRARRAKIYLAILASLVGLHVLFELTVSTWAWIEPIPETEEHRMTIF